MYKLNDDFYNYTNNNWITNNPIPNDKSKWSQFTKLKNENDLKIKKIIENLNSDDNLNILYNQSLNKNKYNNNSMKLIMSYINFIEKQNNIQNLWIFMVSLSSFLPINLPLFFEVNNNFNNASQNILFISDGGLGLPNRDYYFNKSFENNKNDYLQFINKYSNLFNLNLDSKKILLFEEVLANKTFTSSEQRNAHMINNIRNIHEIKNDFPNLHDTIIYFFTLINKKLNFANNYFYNINICNLKFLKEINDLFSNKYLLIWKQYFKWKLILSVHNFINDDIELSYIEFYNFKLKGEKEIESSWLRSIENIDNLLGQELGMHYVKNYYNDEISDTVNNMFISIKKVINKSLQNNDWLKDNTKNKAIKKLDKIKIKVGHPNKCGLKNYSKLKLLLSNDFLINIMITYKYNFCLNFDEIYKKKNLNSWFMNAHYINAYYSPTYNEIVIPAGILQEPFFYNNLNELSKNFGGIGSVIGHEIIHAFDDEGSLYDEFGNLNNWWDKQDNIIYKKNIEIFKKQFENYTFMDQKFNMDLTIGENIADLGGLKFALYALKEQPNKNLKDFFINYSNIWANTIRLEKLKQNVLTDPHLPSILRVNGILKNIDEFYDTFNIFNGNMFISKKNRIVIW